MATRNIPQLTGPMAEAAITALDGLAINLRRGGLALHEDLPLETELVTAADASDLATSITLANELKARWNAHVAQASKHKAADATNVTAAADATNLATTQTLLNEIKADFNAHHASATYHHVGGVGGVAAPANVSTSDASDQSTANALANALKGALNRHLSLGIPRFALVAS